MTERNIACKGKTDWTEKKGRKLTYMNSETGQSKLKSSSQGSLLRSRFVNQMTREEELLERSKRTLGKWFLEMCFKIKKLLYDNFIYTKTF